MRKMTPAERQQILQECEAVRLCEILKMLDHELAKIEDWCKANAWLAENRHGEYEQIVGLAFVACQQYMTALCGQVGVEKKKALSLPPVQGQHVTVAAAVNAAANYWKHHSEWPEDELENKNAKKTFTVLNALGCWTNERYRCFAVLDTLTTGKQRRLVQMWKRLQEWRKEIVTHAATQDNAAHTAAMCGELH